MCAHKCVYVKVRMRLRGEWGGGGGGGEKEREREREPLIIMQADENTRVASDLCVNI